MKRSESKGRQASFLQDALRLISNRFIVMLLSFLSGVILARGLGSEGRGVIAAVMVYPAMFLSLTEMGVRQSSVYYLGKGLFTDKQVVGAVSSLILLTGLVGILASACLVAAMGNASFTPLIIALAVATVPLTLIKDYSSGILLGKRLVGQFAHINRMAETQRLLMVVILVWWLSYGILGALVASLLSSLLVAGFALYRVAQIASLRPRWEGPVLKALLVKGAVYATAMFVLSLNYKVDIALMERFSTVSEIGIYTIAVGIAQLTWALPQSITTALFSHGANAKDPAAFSHKVAKLFRVTVVISLLVVLGLAVTSPFLIPLLYGQEFASSVRPLLLLLPGVFCLLGLKILNMDLAGRGRPNLSLCVTVPALLINVALNVYLLPRYGASGASVASSISYTAAGVGLILLYCRITGIGLGELWRYRRSDFDFILRLLPARYRKGRGTP